MVFKRFHRIQYPFIILVAFYYSLSSNAHDCYEYKTLNEQYECGLSFKKNQNYFLDFGFFFCSIFENEANHSTSKIFPFFIEDTKNCLLGGLSSSLEKGDGCILSSKKAIQTHSNCYINSGYCKLSANDQRAVFDVLFKNKAKFLSLNRTVFIEFLEVMIQCSVYRK